MDNKAQGTIWNNPSQFTLPASDYAQPPVNVSFTGRIKISKKNPTAPVPGIRR